MIRIYTPVKANAVANSNYTQWFYLWDGWYVYTKRMPNYDGVAGNAYFKGKNMIKRVFGKTVSYG